MHRKLRCQLAWLKPARLSACHAMQLLLQGEVLG